MLVVGLSFLVSAQAPSLTVLSREGRKPLPVTTINNQDYVAVDDLNAAFGTTSREDRQAGGLTITARSRSIVVTANQNVVSVSGRLVSLPAPPCAATTAGSCRSISFRARCRSRSMSRLDLRRAARLLVVGDLRVPRVVARVDAGTTNVAVTFESHAEHRGARQRRSPAALVVQFEADALELQHPAAAAADLPAGTRRRATRRRRVALTARAAVCEPPRHDVAAGRRLRTRRRSTCCRRPPMSRAAPAAPPRRAGHAARRFPRRGRRPDCARWSSIRATAATSSARRAPRARSRKRSRCRSRAGCAR